MSMKKMGWWLLSAAMAVPLAHAAPVVTLVDDRGVTVRLDGPPARIVTLLPSLTETVCELGGCARLVGTDRYSNHPASVRSLPKTGGLLFFDTMVIPADAPHPGNAHKFINYILRPEVHASITNKVFYANPNKESRKFIKPEVANDPTVFPVEAEMKKMSVPEAINNDIRRLMTRTYTSFKTGL